MAGFVANAGTDWSRGDAREIAARLDTLGKRLDVTIYGLSGIRTPAHSVAVGGFADDPHTKAEAGDIAVNSQLRASAASLSDADLASVGLYRPFAGATEINHVQLKAGSSSSSTAAAPASSPSSTQTAPATSSSSSTGLFGTTERSGAVRALLYTALTLAGVALLGLGVTRVAGLGAHAKLDPIVQGAL